VSEASLPLLFVTRPCLFPCTGEDQCALFADDNDEITDTAAATVAQALPPWIGLRDVEGQGGWSGHGQGVGWVLCERIVAGTGIKSHGIKLC